VDHACAVTVLEASGNWHRDRIAYPTLYNVTHADLYPDDHMLRLTVFGFPISNSAHTSYRPATAHLIMHSRPV
jgi:hypothetical protein